MFANNATIAWRRESHIAASSGGSSKDSAAELLSVLRAAHREHAR